MRGENEAILEDTVVLLQRLLALRATGRSTGRSISDSISCLKDAEQSISIRAANAIGILKDAVDNPNISSFARVALWKALSELEAIRE